MVYWLIGAVAIVIVCARVWRKHPKIAFGLLLGLPIAWGASRLLEPYLAGGKPVPVWLPPLPFAIVAVTLFVFGGWVWVRGTRSGPRPGPADRGEPELGAVDSHHLP